MIDLDNLRQHIIEVPEAPTLLGTRAYYDAIPETHKDQLFFLDEEATTFLRNYAKAIKLVTGEMHDPFKEGNFRSVERYYMAVEDREERFSTLKEWLFLRQIPFQRWCYVIPDEGPAFLATWKMIVKHGGPMFDGNETYDVQVFDHTLNWCLFYWHHDTIIFGQDNIYDRSRDEERMETINALKQQFPGFSFPY